MKYKVDEKNCQSDLQTLLDIEKIKRLKIQYMRSFDERRWNDLRRCFSNDATVGPSGPVVSGHFVEKIKKQPIDNWIKWVNNPDWPNCIHIGHMAEVDILNQSEAQGTWIATVVFYADSSESTRTYARYFDQFRKEDDRWVIISQEVAMMHHEQIPRTSIWEWEHGTPKYNE